MSSSSAAKLLFASILALSLAGKLAASASVPYPGQDPAAVAAERMLRNAGYETKIVRTERSPKVFVTAVRGDCRLLAGEYPVHGTFADVYRDLAKPFGRLLYAHRGVLHDREPKLAALFDFLTWRELRRVGVDVNRAPVIAVAASEACALETLPWNQIASLSG